jgi:hypothetical protein
MIIFYLGEYLSREYYYIGTQLPIDRFLVTFYYGHPGLHINNILVILSVQITMVASKLICVPAYDAYADGVSSGLPGYSLCRYDSHGN